MKIHAKRTGRPGRDCPEPEWSRRGPGCDQHARRVPPTSRRRPSGGGGPAPCHGRRQRLRLCPGPRSAGRRSGERVRGGPTRVRPRVYYQRSLRRPDGGGGHRQARRPGGKTPRAGGPVQDRRRGLRRRRHAGRHLCGSWPHVFAALHTAMAACARLPPRAAEETADAPLKFNARATVKIMEPAAGQTAAMLDAAHEAGADNIGGDDANPYARYRPTSLLNLATTAAPMSTRPSGTRQRMSPCGQAARTRGRVSAGWADGRDVGQARQILLLTRTVDGADAIGHRRGSLPTRSARSPDATRKRTASPREPIDNTIPCDARYRAMTSTKDMADDLSTLAGALGNPVAQGGLTLAVLASLWEGRLYGLDIPAPAAELGRPGRFRRRSDLPAC